jgi:hypothetical protein
LDEGDEERVIAIVDDNMGSSVTKKRWTLSADVLCCVAQVLLLLCIFLVPPSGKGFDFAVDQFGRALGGFIISVAAMIFALVTKKFWKAQGRFAIAFICTSVAWGLLCLLASVAV